MVFNQLLTLQLCGEESPWDSGGRLPGAAHVRHLQPPAQDLSFRGYDRQGAQTVRGPWHLGTPPLPPPPSCFRHPEPFTKNL